MARRRTHRAESAKKPAPKVEKPTAQVDKIAKAVKAAVKKKS